MMDPDHQYIAVCLMCLNERIAELEAENEKLKKYMLEAMKEAEAVLHDAGRYGARDKVHRAIDAAEGRKHDD